MAHHAYTRDALEWMRDAFQHLELDDAPGVPSLLELRKAFQALEHALARDMRQEDTILFPLIVRLESSGMSAFGRVEAHVRTMVEDHDTVVGLLRTLRSLTNDYAIPSRVSVEYGELLSGLASLDADLREHLRLEQEVLLPRLMALEV